MDKINTDVPESIAGYYYQILLAIRELTKLSNNEDSVGIEKGADVRIFIKNGNTSSIEAKFYKNKMNKSSEAIIHTIYNFYNNLIDDDNLYFETNVEIEDTLLDSISEVKDNSEITEEQLKYICIAIMKEFSGKNSNEENKTIKDCFKEYLQNQSKLLPHEIQFNSKVTDRHYGYYYEQFKNIETISFWGKEINKERVKQLIKKIEFRGGIKEKKYESILALKKDIGQRLTKYDIKEIHIDNVIKALVDMFLATTISNNNFDRITLEDFNSKLKSIKDNDYKISLEYYNEKFVKNIEDLDERFRTKIENFYEGTYKEKILERYSIIREIILGKLRSNIDKPIDEILKTYSYANGTITTLDKIITISTILTIYNGTDSEYIKIIDENFKNLEIDNETFIYKEHDFNKGKRILGTFIRETNDDIHKMDEEAIVLFAPCTSCEKLCDVDIKNSIVFNIASVDENIQTSKFYKKLKYKCDQCIYIYDDDEEANIYIQKFKNCKGWKSWE